jgi:4-hydroxybenzoate polyprenyltransferase
MLVHQIQDVANDRLAKVQTWTTFLGEERARLVTDRVVFPAEAASFALIAALLIAVSPWFLLGLAPALPNWFVLASRRRISGLRYETLPLVDVYRFWWPAATLGALIAADWRYVAIAIVYFTVFPLWRSTLRLVRRVRARARPRMKVES